MIKTRVTNVVTYIVSISLDAIVGNLWLLGVCHNVAHNVRFPLLQAFAKLATNDTLNYHGGFISRETTDSH